MIRKLNVLLFCVFSVLATVSTAAGQEVATAVQVTGSAEFSIDGQRFIMRNGTRISDGAEIKTAADGTVQLTFDDGTNMVVGQSSTLQISEVLMTPKNVASRFAVKAVVGGFRFITGNSPKKNYEITTPTATMGVRGTEFDLVVSRSRTTLALFEGAVHMCRGVNQCAIVSGSCAIARTDFLKGIRAVSGKGAASTLTKDFSFVAEQKELRKEFRTTTKACGRYFRVESERKPPPPVKPAPPAPKLPAPKPQEPNPPAPKPQEPNPPAPKPPAPKPPVVNPPAPEPPSGNFPGGSGSSGPSEGKGGGASAGQNGSGTGAGQGAKNRNGGTGGKSNGGGKSGKANGGKAGGKGR